MAANKTQKEIEKQKYQMLLKACKVLGGDIALYRKLKFNIPQLIQILKGLESKLDVSYYLDPKFSAPHMEILRKGLAEGIFLKMWLEEGFDWPQLEQIYLGYMADLPIDRYGFLEYSAEQMEQIRLGLEEKLDISVYATPGISADTMKSTREKLLFARDSSQLVNDMISLSETEIMASIEAELEVQQNQEEAEDTPVPLDDSSDSTEETSVSISQDLMSASICLAPPRKEPYTMEALITLLEKHNIKQGINLAILQRIIRKEMYMEEIVIARGKEATDGADGEFTFHFRTEKSEHKPTILPDGSVDYFNSSAFEFAKEGQLLAEYTPATLGEYGYTVTGKLIIPKRGKDLPVLRGRGFAISEDNKQYTATCSGLIDYTSNILNVINCLTINHDLDISIGNINFDGNVEIMGNIIPNMMIHATGTVKVNGYVESASIYAGQDVVLSKGIQGGGVSYIEAGGNVFAPFFESTTIKCEGSLNANHILNCDVTANDSVILSGKRGLILGGTTRALRYIDATTSGNKAELPTKLVLGVDAEVIKDYGEIMQSISKAKLEVSALRKNLVIFEEQAQTEHYTYKMLQKAIKMKEDDLATLGNQLNDYNRVIELASNASANFLGNVYPGTSVFINGEKHFVKEEQRQVTYRLRDRKIIMEEYTSPKDSE